MLARDRLAAVVIMLGLTSQTGCPYPPQFPEAAPEPNRPPMVDASGTNPYYAGGPLVVGSRPMLTIEVFEFDEEDTLSVKVIKDLDVSLAGENQTPHKVLLDGVEIGPEDVPPSDPGAEVPDGLRSKQVELQMTPCPTGSESTEPVLTVCISDRGFITYPDTLDPCQPGNRNSTRDEERGYVARYDIVYQCMAAP